jgi:two-component system NtrC family sensor kinase
VTPGALHVAAESRRALYPRLVLAAMIHSGAVWTQWGHWSRVGALCAAFGAYTVATVVLARFWDRETPFVALARFLTNVSIVLAAGHLSDWSFPTFLYLPFHALSRESANFRAQRINYLAIITVIGAVALLEHGNTLGVVTFSVLGAAAYGSSERRLRFACKMLDELAQRNTELSQAHAALRAMQARAIEQEKLSGLGMLAAGVAHEINNPMAFVTANVNLLLEELRNRSGLDQTLAEFVDDVLPATVEGIQRVNAIVGDLRRFARGDIAGMVSYDLNEQVHAALRIMRSRVKDSGDLDIALEPLPRTTGLPQQLVQVIINLLDNAVDAHSGPTRGNIRVATASDGDTVILRVSDRGIGMTPEVRSKLFQPFFTSKQAGHGTGLGLSVVYGIVKAHGGTIDVETAPGQGTTFTIRLPVEPGRAGRGSGLEHATDDRAFSAHAVALPSPAGTQTH